MSGFGWDYPPGVRESDIPGFRPGDEAIERIAEGITDNDLLDFIEDQKYDAGGTVLWPDEDRGVWYLQPPDDEPELADGQRIEVWGKKGQWIRIVFDTEFDALAYWIEFYGEEVREQLIELETERACGY